MMIFLRGIPFLIHEAFLNVRRHGLMTLAVTSTVAIALCILGVFSLIAWQFHVVTDALPKQFEIHAFLAQDLAPERVAEVKAAVTALPGVRSVTLVTKEEAWNDYKGHYPGLKSDLEGLDRNPLPDKLEVQAVSPERALAVAARIRGIGGVERVLDGAHVLRTLLAIGRIVRTASL